MTLYLAGFATAVGLHWARSFVRYLLDVRRAVRMVTAGLDPGHLTPAVTVAVQEIMHEQDTPAPPRNLFP